MKALLLLTLLLSNLSAQTIFLPQKNRNSPNHKASFDTNRTLNLLTLGKWNAVVVAPPDAAPVSRYAAQELTRILGQMAGASIAMETRLSKDKINLLVGFHALSDFASDKKNSLPRDGFVIESVEVSGAPVILIAGKDDPTVQPEVAQKQKNVWNQNYERGSVFAIYDFLERFAGCRFFFPDVNGVVIPQANGLSLFAMKVFEAPDSTVRRHSYIFKSMASIDPRAFLPGNEDQNSDRGYLWANRERDFYRHETLLIPTGHGLARMGLVERFGESHPEYFALQANGLRDVSLEPNRGHLCLLSQGLEDEVVADAVSYFKGEPPSVRNTFQGKSRTPVWNLSAFQPGYFNLMPQDAFGENTRCRCSQCQSFFQTNNSLSEYVFRFVTRVAQRLKDSRVNATVATMAYSTYLDIPSVSFPDNVIVQVAPMGPWMEKFPQIQSEQDRLIQAWNQKLGRPKSIFLWNYVNDYASAIPYGTPSFAPRKIASYYKRLSPLISGAFLQSSTSYRLYNYLNWSVFFKVMWDNEFEIEPYLADHHLSMFGKGAGKMARFYDDLEKAWDECIGEYRNTEMGPGFRAKTESEVWDQIITATRLEQWAAFFDGAEKDAKEDPSSLSRIRYMRSQLLGAIVDFRKKFIAEKREIEDLTYPSLRASQPPILDGDLAESVWQDASAMPLSLFKKSGRPQAGTLVRTAWTPGFLHVGIECLEDKMADIQSIERAHDDPKIWQDSCVEIFLGLGSNRSQYAHILINASGSVSDEKHDQEGPDWKWESGVSSVVKRLADRYVVECSIPIPEKSRALFANFTRSRVLKSETSKNELQTLSPFIVKGFHDPENFGSLRLVETQGATDPENMVVNGSFEELLGNAAKGWSDKGVAIDSEDSRHGKNSLKISSAEISKSQLASVQTLRNLKPSTEYLLSYFVRYEGIESDPSSGSGGGFSTVFFGQANHFFPSQRYRGSSPWKKEVFSFKTSTDLGETLYLKLGLLSAKGAIWFDDVRIREKNKS